MIGLLAMTSRQLIIGLLVVLLVPFFIFLILTYNKLVQQRELIRNAMGQIAAQIESRWDLVSNLIQTAKQYSEHEANLLRDIAVSRSTIGKEADVAEVNQDDRSFNRALGHIMAVAEQYPELKADGVYKHAMTEIKNTEEHVRYARMAYNDCVTKYNRICLTFPSSIAAFLLRFKEGEYFQHQEIKSGMPQW